MESTGRGHLTGIFLPKGAWSQICQNHGAGALSWNPRGGGTELEFEFLKGPPHRSVRTTGRGHWAGIHGAGALNLGMRCHKDTPFDNISLLISTNQKPGFLALGQWEALILQKFMSTFQINQICENYGAGALKWNSWGGGTK